MLDDTMHYATILWALGSTLTWGSSDFAGGLAARNHHIYSVLLTAQLSSLLPLILLVVLFERVMPRGSDLLIGGAAGVFGVIGLLNLYKGLAIGRMSIVTPLIAIIANSLPVLVSLFIEGLPTPLKLFGFGMALMAVWLLSSDGKRLTATPEELRFASFSGLGFAGIFICFDQVSGETSFWPVLSARIVSIIITTAYLMSRRNWHTPASRLVPLIVITGLLDTMGNYCFVMAGHYGRLDIATSVASLYPAITILLAWLLLRETLKLLQLLGMVLALVAITLIAL